MKTGRIITNATVNKIKAEIAAGRPVIAPTAGKILPNPNFTDGGPNYHMLVITDDGTSDFITSDPEIRNGKNFHYTYDTLFNAIRDWNPINISN